MDEMNPQIPQEQPQVPQEPVRRRRRKRSKLQIFKETYLPVIIAGLTAVFLLVVIIGSISRAVSVHKANKEQEQAASEAAAALLEKQTKEVNDLISRADAKAAIYDYEGAVEILDSFTGTVADFPQLLSKREGYLESQKNMVEWNDPSKIPNLSFQLLIADPARAFVDTEYGSKYNRNYVTTDEFAKILQQLYDRGFMLVSLRDIVATEVADDGTKTYSAGSLYLPPDKKPLVLTQCAVNYFTYMTDGDGDGFPDKDGDGFAYRLLQDDQGKFVNEMIDAQGNTVTGAFDVVPILEEFIAAHPDFSYRGARAILAVTGYDGVFGYRTDYDTRSICNEGETDGYTTEYYNNEVLGARNLVKALREGGYEIASYTYDLFGYGDENAERIQKDLDNWAQEVTPVLGDVGILVYPFGADIAEYHEDAYKDGERYEVLRDAGFRYFIGQDSSKDSWADVNDDYFRMTRRLVTGAFMAYSPEVFDDLFDASTVLSTARGTVPEN